VWIDEFWSQFFGIETSIWSTPGLTVTQHVHFGDWRGIWFFRRAERWVIAAPVDWVERLRVSTANLDAQSFLQEETLRGLIGDAFDRCIGPAFRGYLDPAQFRPIVDPSVRPLTSADRPLIDAIADECRETGWDPLQKGTQFQCASFHEGEIVALSGYRRWTDNVGDPFIFVRASHRRKGLGSAVTSAVVDQALLAGKMLLYQTLESNELSVRIALRLGYARDSTGMSVRLRS
jgi:GNAT superfamily N-acetyltransferase